MRRIKIGALTVVLAIAATVPAAKLGPTMDPNGVPWTSELIIDRGDKGKLC